MVKTLLQVMENCEEGMYQIALSISNDVSLEVLRFQCA